MSCDLCEDCQKKRQIKYTEVEDINNLINEFSGNITGGNIKTQMYMDIYDLYYNHVGGLLLEMLPDKLEDWKGTLEWFLDEDLEEEIREDLNDKQGMIDIYNEYIPLGSGGFNLFDSDIRQTLLEKIHNAYYKLEFEIMVDVFFDIQELFSSRVKNKTFYQLK